MTNKRPAGRSGLGVCGLDGLVCLCGVGILGDLGGLDGLVMD